MTDLKITPEMNEAWCAYEPIGQITETMSFARVNGMMRHAFFSGMMAPASAGSPLGARPEGARSRIDRRRGAEADAQTTDKADHIIGLSGAGEGAPRCGQIGCTVMVPHSHDEREPWRITLGTARERPAHRVAYETLVAPIDEALVCDHLCLNKACCNPAHIEPVTSRENTLRATRLNSGSNLKIFVRKHGREERRCRRCRRNQELARVCASRAKARAIRRQAKSATPSESSPT